MYILAFLLELFNNAFLNFSASSSSDNPEDELNVSSKYSSERNDESEIFSGAPAS